jgi:hypothetical protein
MVARGLIRCLALLALGVQTCMLPLVAQTPTPPATFTFGLAVALAESLDAIADTATVEHARCLYGVTTPDGVTLTRAFEPHVIEADWMTYSGDMCPGQPLAFWHVHIPHNFNIMGIRSGGDAEPRDYCFLSRPDMISTLRPVDPPLQLVGVGHRLLCWWSRQEVASRLKPDSMPVVLWPDPARGLFRLPPKEPSP